MRDGFVKVAAGTPRIKVADCAGNAGQLAGLMEGAAAQGVKVLALPELCLTGYTCGDLFLQPALLRGAEQALGQLLARTAGLDLLAAVGLPVMAAGKLFNCAALICRGRLLGLIPKSFLPNYGEFYEQRWFTSGAQVDQVVELCGQSVRLSPRQLFPCDTLPGLTVGVEICEDLWAACPPSTALAQAGATLMLNLSASNELVGKGEYRRALVTGQSARLLCAYVYADAGEGESTTDLVFCGHDLVAENGVLLAQEQFGAGLVCAEIDVDRLCYERRRLNTFPPAQDDFHQVGFSLNPAQTALTRPVSREPFVPALPARGERCEEILRIAALGLKKRLEHVNASAAVIGLSGGLDSTLALLITVRAFDYLGWERARILGVTMPCFGTTQRTRSNAEVLAAELGATLRTVDITAAVERHFADIGHSAQERDVVYENAQARERTQVLMDLANGSGALVVGTGDLSELALGWCTYNGDHMSMYAVNAGIPKTLVRHLVAHEGRLAGGRLEQVLQDILDTPVSPELLPPRDGEIAQRTEELVGPYELHDFYLYYAIRWGFPPRKVLRLAEYAFQGVYSRGVLLRWLRGFYRRFFAQQFKRSCLPDGPKVGSVALSPRGDWRMPSDAEAALWLEELEGLE